jgi:hypothetical protein
MAKTTAKKTKAAAAPPSAVAQKSTIPKQKSAVTRTTGRRLFGHDRNQECSARRRRIREHGGIQPHPAILIKLGGSSLTVKIHRTLSRPFSA